MTSRQARINEDLSKSATQLVIGTYYTTNSDGTVQVDFGAGSTTCQVAGMFHRTPGETVWVLRVGPVSLVLGPTNVPHSFGEVSAVNGTLATVTTPSGDVTLPWAVTTPVASDVAAIVNGWVFVGASEIPETIGDPGPGGGGTRTVDFRATDSGSWNGGSWWTNEVWASDSNKGAWFYDSSVADTIPDTATINAVSVFVPEFSAPYSGLAAIGTHSLPNKSGAPSISSPSAVAGGAGWRSLPTGLGDSLKTGVARGLGYQQATAGVGWRKVSARSTDADSGLLRITFTT